MTTIALFHLMDQFIRLQCEHLTLQSSQFLFQLRIFMQHLFYFRIYIDNTLHLQIICYMTQCLFFRSKVFISTIACLCRNTADTATNTFLRDNLAYTNFLCVIYMTATTEFFWHIAHCNNPDNIPVFFIKQCGSSALLCFFNRHFHLTYRMMFTDKAVYQLFNFL